MSERKAGSAKGLGPRACLMCGAEFQPYRDAHVVCSRRCQAQQPHIKAASRAWNQVPENRDRKNAARRVEANPEVRRAQNFRANLRQYGMTPDEYHAMHDAQGGVCAICGAPPKPGGVKAASRLHVDHCHDTGRVRALLCNGCNRGIGYLNDDPDLLQRAVDYLRHHRET